MESNPRTIRPCADLIEQIRAAVREHIVLYGPPFSAMLRVAVTEINGATSRFAITVTSESDFTPPKATMFVVPVLTGIIGVHVGEVYADERETDVDFRSLALPQFVDPGPITALGAPGLGLRMI